MASIAAAIAGIGAIAGGTIGAIGANSAADTTAGAENNATQVQQQEFNQTQANEAPWLQAGNVSLQQLMAGLAPGGSLSTPDPNSTFTTPTLAQAEQNPGYQFTQQQGNQAIEASAAASGGAFTGNEAEALDQYNQNLATTNYSNVYNQALQTFGTNFNAYNTNQSNLYNKLASSSGLGQTAATQLGQIGGTAATAEGNTIVGAGQANAAGTLGITNSLAGAINGVTNNTSGYLSLQSLLNGNPNYGSPTGLPAYTPSPVAAPNYPTAPPAQTYDGGYQDSLPSYSYPSV